MIDPVLKKELKEIIRHDYGKNLKDKELTEVAGSLIDYFETLLIIEEKTKNEYENRRSTNQ